MPTTEITDPMLLDSTGQDIVTKLQAIATALATGQPQPSGTTPLMDGTATPGVETAFARGDHVHPTDTTRAAASLEINGHALTGDIDLVAGDIGYDGTDSGLVADNEQDAIDELAEMLPDTILAPPAADGTYVLQCTVSNGEFTYQWVSSA